jgi:hypothetical protein
MRQWDGVWSDTLRGLEFLISDTRRADIVACSLHWNIIFTLNNCSSNLVLDGVGKAATGID